jgi:predicted  nucleic acid-binding Zn-ribbon protein
VSIEEMRRLDALKTYKELQEAKERIKHLENAIRKTLDENRHLADGENCTLIELKKALPEWT